jgi:hypothetical protein
MAAAPKKQSLMDIFLKDTAMMGDERLAKEMRASRRVKAKPSGGE